MDLAEKGNNRIENLADEPTISEAAKFIQCSRTTFVNKHKANIRFYKKPNKDIWVCSKKELIEYAMSISKL